MQIKLRDSSNELILGHLDSLYRDNSFWQLSEDDKLKTLCPHKNAIDGECVGRTTAVATNIQRTGECWGVGGGGEPWAYFTCTTYEYKHELRHTTVSVAKITWISDSISWSENDLVQ